MAGWSSVVVVVAKSLALVCTKDQNRFCFSIWNQKKFFSHNPQMKKEPPPPKNPLKTKKPQPNPKTKQKNWKQKLNTFQVIRTNNYPMIFILV